MHSNPPQSSTASRSAPVSQVQGSYTVQHDFDGSASVAATIVHALSDVAGIDATQAEFALHDYVDPDALDKLFAPTSDGPPRLDGHVTFNVRGYQTTLYANGVISIVPPATQHQPQQL